MIKILLNRVTPCNTNFKLILKRSDISFDIKQIFKNLGTMEEFRNAALYN